MKQTKHLDKVSNDLCTKIIQNGNNPFQLWLEFEISSPWDDLENDFANIAVDTLDGRYYGINVWTFKYLETASKEVLEENNQPYLIPPDLFVQELTRPCVEATIKDLLNQGNLEALLNYSIFNLKFIAPYQDVDALEETRVEALLHELKLELGEQHPLYHLSVDLLAERTDQDALILQLEDGRITVVHLTWKGSQETQGYPNTRIYQHHLDFWNQEMKQAILEFEK